MNAIAVFVLAGIVGRLFLEIRIPAAAGDQALKTWLYARTFAHWPDPKIASLGWALAHVLGFYLVAYAMHRRKWYLKF
jgi:predicted acyltransferase